MTDAIYVVYGTYVEFDIWNNPVANCDTLIATKNEKLALEVYNEYRNMPDQGEYQNIIMETFFHL